MDGVELNNTCLHKFPKFPLWIIEYVWAHKTMEIQEVVDPSNWPEVDSQPLSLEDSWRLRVASAQVYSIVKNRDMERFERVMGFLEATYRLLPRLVAPIKHMKILFGLKTMVIMRMLREGRGMVDTVLKTSHFFPRRFPQYQGQCSQHEMFLMRKSHLDFKALAQALAMDKDKLEDYVKNQMEEQYGEHYAQKVEDRLLHYLQEVETALPGDTYIDKILKKESPVTEEEKLLLEVIASDSANIATTLKKLLHCVQQFLQSGRYVGRVGGDYFQQQLLLSHGAFFLQTNVASCRPGGINLLDSMEAKAPLQRSEEDSSDEEVSPRSRAGVKEAPSSPQFCSKHRRWVRSILQECPDECSEELLLQADVSSSPPLFQSSSSATSSQDLTPSDLVPCPPDRQHPPSLTSTHLQTAVQASEQVDPKDEQRSGSPGLTGDGSQRDPSPRPSSSRDTQPPVLLSPVVRLIDIASVGRIYPIFKPHRAPLNYFTVFSNKEAASALRPQVLASPHHHTPGNNAIPLGRMKDTTINQPDTVATTTPPNTTCKVKTAPFSQDSSTSCQPPPQRSFSKLSRKFRRACATSRPSQAPDGFSPTPLPERIMKAPTTLCPPLPDINVSGPPIEEASTSIPQGVRPYRRTLNISLFESKTRGHGRPRSTAVSAAANSDCLAVRSETSRVRRAKLKLSRPSQALLLQSKLLQPYVSLNRLSAQECYRGAKPRSCTSCVEAVVQASSDDKEEEEDEDEDADSSFDVNTLYSDDSSSSDSEDPGHCDPEYKPRFKKKRLLSE